MSSLLQFGTSFCFVQFPFPFKVIIELLDTPYITDKIHFMLNPLNVPAIKDMTDLKAVSCNVTLCHKWVLSFFQTASSCYSCHLQSYCLYKAGAHSANMPNRCLSHQRRQWNTDTDVPLMLFLFYWAVCFLWEVHNSGNSDTRKTSSLNVCVPVVAMVTRQAAVVNRKIWTNVSSDCSCFFVIRPPNQNWEERIQMIEDTRRKANKI